MNYLPYVYVSASLRNCLRKLKGPPLAVFLSIALRIGKTKTSWPSEATIKEETGYSKSTISRTVSFLKAEGYISVVRRGRNTGSQKSANVYSVPDSLVKYGYKPELVSTEAEEYIRAAQEAENVR